jgi:hypothetical protein
VAAEGWRSGRESSESESEDEAVSHSESEFESDSESGRSRGEGRKGGQGGAKEMHARKGGSQSMAEDGRLLGLKGGVLV